MLDAYSGLVLIVLKGQNHEYCVELFHCICVYCISRLLICLLFSYRPSRPDLVGDSGFGKPGSYLSSSLPDVSSVNCKCSSTSVNMGAEDSSVGSHDSRENVSSQENVTELKQDEPLDGADIDWEQEACMAVEDGDLGLLDARVLAQPVLFAESIGQRARRERGQTRTTDRDTNTLKSDFSESVRKANQDDFAEDYTGDAENLNTEQLKFVGDWPSESLGQRGQRSRKSAPRTVKTPNEEMTNVEGCTSKFKSKMVGHLDSETPNKTEFQKLLDLLQGDDNRIIQETTQDFLSLDGDRHQSDLVTMSQPILPDCVLDWMSERPGDPGKGNSHTPSPVKELGASQNVSFEGARKEACTDVHTPTNGLIGLETGSEQEDKPNCDADLSLNSGGDVEYSSGSSQERRKGPSRRVGKSCKLALTFTHQSPSSWPHAGSPVTSLLQSEQNLSKELLFTKCSSAFAQTEPQDFALLWRIEQEKCSEPKSNNCTRGTVVLEGNPLRFVPKIDKEKSHDQQVIPYRVCHEKSSQVEENDLREVPFKQNSLEILRCHFKHVPKETLEDLYEKCHHDMEWTINLLLDSGEHLRRDDEGDQHAEKDDLVQGAKEDPSDCQVTGESKINCTRDTVIEEIGRSCCKNPDIVVQNNTSMSMGIVERGPGTVSNDQDIKLLEHHLQESDQRETLECVPGPSQCPNEPAGENKALKGNLPLELGSGVLQTDIFEEYLDGGHKDEVDDDREAEEEVNAIMLSLLDEMERKKEEQRKEREKDRRAQRKNGPMNIQTLELKLTTELALQLTELFGPVGISSGK